MSPETSEAEWRALPEEHVACTRIARAIEAALVLGAALGMPLYGVARIEALAPYRTHGWFLLGAAAVAASLAVWLVPRLAWRHTSWRLREGALQIRRGILWRHVLDVPRERVQHTDVGDGPLLRKFGLARLVVFTAGTRFARVELSGIAKDTALELRDVLVQRDRAPRGPA